MLFENLDNKFGEILIKIFRLKPDKAWEGRQSIGSSKRSKAKFLPRFSRIDWSRMTNSERYTGRLVGGRLESPIVGLKINVYFQEISTPFLIWIMRNSYKSDN